MEDKITVIYIISDRRSGSTLLENILSKSPETVSAGELAMLNGHIHKEGPGEIWNWSCSCGKPVLECEFWSKVLSEIYDPALDTKITWPYKSATILLSSILPGTKRKLLNFVHTKKNSATIENLNAVYAAMTKTSEKNFIVDSSKDPMQALAINECKNVAAKFIWLSRDLRAITFSKLKRWKVNKRSNKGPFETLTDSFYYKKVCAACLQNISEKDFIKINYEALVADPQQELNKICVATGLKRFEAPLYMELSNDHTIAGTPGRFKKKQITADNSWKEFYKDHAMLNMLGKVLNAL